MRASNYWILAGLFLATPLAAQQTEPVEESARLEVITVEERSEPVQVRPVRSLEEIPKDFWTYGNFGDIKLWNNHASFVFGNEGAGMDNPLLKGVPIDIFTAPSSPENFQVIRPSTRFRPQHSIKIQEIDYATNPEEQSGWFKAVGNDSAQEGVAAETLYEMKPTWPGLLATTTLTNNSEETITLPFIGDYAGWGAMGVFLPASGWQMRPGSHEGAEFVFARLFDSIIYIQPAEGLMTVHHNLQESHLVYAEDVALAPGESVSYSRWILTVQRDPSILYSFATQQRHPDRFGYMAGRVVEMVQLPDGRAQETALVADSEVRIASYVRRDLPGNYTGRPYIYAVTDAQGNFQIALPEGEYNVSSAHPARVYQPSNLAIRVRANEVTAVDHAVSRPSTVLYEVVDAETGAALPAKLSFLPLRGTEPPDFGPPGGLESHNTAYSRNGKGVLEVPPGNYRVVASHGNEYHMAEQRVRVQPLESVTIKFELERAFQPEGWISADLGVLTDEASHSRTDAETRVISALVEGLTWIVTANPDTATDLQPTVERLGLQDRLRASPGYRMTNSIDRLRGDYLVFPVEECAVGVETDFSLVADAVTPEEAIEGLRALCPYAIVMVNRPTFPDIGLLSIQGYDLQTGAFPETGEMFMDVDGFQIWEGKREKIVFPTYRAFEELVARGNRLVPLANSLSAGTVNEEPGYPRVYIRSSERQASKLDIKELVRNIKAGQVQLTNGPFIDLKINGQGPGAMVTPNEGYVEVELKVYAPNWANVSTVSLLQNGRLVRQVIIPAAAAEPDGGLVFPTKRSQDDGEFRLRVTEDSIFTVIVEGDPSIPQDPVNPLLIPTPDTTVTQGQRTFAITAPVLVDADGDGRIDIQRRPEPERDPAPPF